MAEFEQHLGKNEELQIGQIVEVTYEWGSSRQEEARYGLICERDGQKTIDFGGGGIWLSSATEVKVIEEDQVDQALQQIESHKNNPDSFHNRFQKLINEIYARRGNE